MFIWLTFYHFTIGQDDVRSHPPRWEYIYVISTFSIDMIRNTNELFVCYFQDARHTEFVFVMIYLAGNPIEDLTPTILQDCDPFSGSWLSQSRPTCIKRFPHIWLFMEKGHRTFKIIQDPALKSSVIQAVLLNLHFLEPFKKFIVLLLKESLHFCLPL